MLVQLEINLARDNLVHSAILELFEFLRRENVKSVIAHIAEAYEARLELLTHIDVFRGLVLRHQQNAEQHEGGGSGTDGCRAAGGQSPCNRGAAVVAERGRRAPLDIASGRRAFPDDDDDDAYFNESDEDDEDTAIGPPLPPSTGEPPTRPCGFGLCGRSLSPEPPASTGSILGKPGGSMPRWLGSQVHGDSSALCAEVVAEAATEPPSTHHVNAVAQGSRCKGATGAAAGERSLKSSSSHMSKAGGPAGETVGVAWRPSGDDARLNLCACSGDFPMTTMTVRRAEAGDDHSVSVAHVETVIDRDGVECVAKRPRVEQPDPATRHGA